MSGSEKKKKNENMYDISSSKSVTGSSGSFML